MEKEMEKEMEEAAATNPEVSLRHSTVTAIVTLSEITAITENKLACLATAAKELSGTDVRESMALGLEMIMEFANTTRASLPPARDLQKNIEIYLSHTGLESTAVKLNAECKIWTENTLLPPTFFEALGLENDWDAAITKAKIERSKTPRRSQMRKMAEKQAKMEKLAADWDSTLAKAQGAMEKLEADLLANKPKMADEEMMDTGNTRAKR